ncbi:MAG: methylated-DNA--[protein]-cysteine S-methyltransferase [Rubrivivax sp.]|jgi:methylated-DNA-[protein]-cysteine S-methyltransferase|nr:methylated-DNA--[protein]-cysteine S-methyltransferase [Rubrivivax sp.]
MNRATPLVAQARLDSPLGPLLAAATAQGLAGLWFDGQRHHPGELIAPLRPDDPHIAATRQQLADYWRGRRRAFDLTLDPQGTPFQQSVWRMLCGIACGATTSYGAIARALARPQAMRAVGAAVGRNPLSIVVPCHRVLGQDGSLTGYAGGLDRKTALLALEREGQPPAALAA